MKTIKISLWGLLCLFFIPGLLSAQATFDASELERVLQNGYGKAVTQVEVGWKTDAGNFYMGSGFITPFPDSRVDETRQPLICQVGAEDNIKWIRYFDFNPALTYMIADTADGNLVAMAKEKGDYPNLIFMEFSDQGEPQSFQIIPLDTAQAFISKGGYRTADKNIPEATEFLGDWRVMHYDRKATLLTREGTLVYNDTLPEDYYRTFTFEDSQDGKLNGVKPGEKYKSIHYLSFSQDGTTRQANYARPRRQWNRRHFLRKHSMPGLYDPHPHRQNVQLFPIAGGREGYLITATTEKRRKFEQNHELGHLLQRIDAEGNPVWTRRYDWPMKIAAVSGTADQLELTTPEGNVEQLDPQGFYIRYGESVRETYNIKDKTIAKYDRKDKEAVVVDVQHNNVVPGKYAYEPTVIMVDSLKKVPKDRNPYYTSGRSYSSGSGNGPLKALGGFLKAVGDTIKGIGNSIRRRTHRRRGLFRRR